jgi:protein-disulfide isomerase
VDESFIRVDNGKKVTSEEAWVTNNTINKLIDQDIEYWSKFGSNIVPSIVINNVTFRGQLETQAVMNALCAGLRDTPGFCNALLHDYDL